MEILFASLVKLGLLKYKVMLVIDDRFPTVELDNGLKQSYALLYTNFPFPLRLDYNDKERVVVIGPGGRKISITEFDTWFILE